MAFCFQNCFVLLWEKMWVRFFFEIGGWRLRICKKSVRSQNLFCKRFYLLLLKWYHLGFCQTYQKLLWRPAGLLVSACPPFWTSNKRLVHTRISAHNFFHSTIIPHLRLSWVSQLCAKFKDIEYVGLVHCLSAKM